MRTALLFGPFVGDIIYEMCYFAPHAIYRKKESSDKGTKLIVFSRPDRLDLYGQYVDIFVPLNLANDLEEFQNGWGSDIYTSDVFSSLISVFKRKFVSRFNDVENFIPTIKGNLSKLKWQFPRCEMDYDFKPRISNQKCLSEILPFKKSFFLCEYKINNVDSTDCITIGEFNKAYQDFKIDQTTYLGTLIELLKQCNFFAGNLSSISGRLALLLKKPIITTEEIKGDSIHLMNPFRVPVSIVNDIEKGIKIYHENYI
jgi:hypothetical protein